MFQEDRLAYSSSDEATKLLQAQGIGGVDTCMLCS
jgi:hypothetical protein